MKKHLLVSLTLGLLVLPSISTAATITELEALVRTLTAQIAALQAQQGSQSQTLQASAASCPNLTRNLFRGMRGTDVIQLQQFLISQNHLAAGNDSGYFGAMTESAVKQFQCAKMNICSGSSYTNGYGSVGPKTRVTIVAMCTSSPQVSPTPTLPTPAPTPTPTLTPPPSTSPTSGSPISSVPAFSSAKYWFAPLPPMPMRAGRDYIGTLDYISLFEPNAPWQTAASRIQVFKLYGEWLLSGNATDAELAKVVADVKRRGMKLAVEAGPLDPTSSCGNGIEGFAGSQWDTLASRIKAAGGTLDYLALDEPYYFAHKYSGTQACNWSADEIARKVQAFIARVKVDFPNVVVGDTEPLVVGDAAAFAEWLDAFKQVNGYALPFLHLDVQWEESAWPQTAKAIEATVRARGVSFGIIYNGDSRQTTDSAWLTAAGNHVKMYELQAGGQPDQVLFQSWNDKPDYALPETSPTTFTNFINAYFGNKSLLGDTPLSEGMFKIGTAVYYTNGTTYCAYKDWADFRALTGLNSIEGIRAVSTIPTSMPNDGICTGVRNLALDKNATASGAVIGSEAGKAFDNNHSTTWNAGSHPSQWIQVDLGAIRTVSGVKLVIEQTPTGQTTHVVSRSVDGATWQTVTTFSGSTASGGVLEYTLSQPASVRYIKVETTTSPAWVAWREIQVLGQ